ncbi:50S ribosomal protein L10 [Candidatus Methylomirabilis lanthanidiphila]|uniref:Large ribosomal subunit protein uL10 n=1 Tax=Candidatus Methylomirabilis lanthanidiphila TaxID=2211376 RepID=A0A564ZPH8_9BACT|nr:50S ribosomal protein L10 [Candidatus Methylomirabilis lanthanidiphila]VUZ86562.1 50S ribosomal protein L10 [Candidatus Methylomirabilis lanthanidiphila]
MNRVEKAAVIDELKTALAGATVAMLADPKGLTMSELTELRKQLRQQGMTLQIVKNTLARLATTGTQLQDLKPYLVGPTAILHGKGDPTGPAKLLATFTKTKPTFQIKAGFAEGTVLGGQDVMALADLPSREVLAAKLAGLMQSPLRGLVVVLNGPLRSLLMVLEAVRQQKG